MYRERILWAQGRKDRIERKKKKLLKRVFRNGKHSCILESLNVFPSDIGGGFPERDRRKSAAKGSKTFFLIGSSLTKRIEGLFFVQH